MGGGKKKGKHNGRSTDQGALTNSTSPNKSIDDANTSRNNDLANDTKATSTVIVSEMKELTIKDEKDTAPGSCTQKLAEEKKVTKEVEKLKSDTRTKEEVIAERKAKAAEAKAKKAAAAAKKAAANANKSAAQHPNEKKISTKNHFDNQGSNEGKVQQKTTKDNIEQMSTSASSLKGSGDQCRIPASLPSSCLSTPFRHVHFDMIPTNADRKVHRQPSQCDTSTADVHPAFLSFAARCASGHVVGIDAICIAFIDSFKQFLLDYTLDPNVKMSYDFDMRTDQQIRYLTENGTHPLPLALWNIVRQLKKEINQLPATASEITGKETLRDWLDDFVMQNFDLAFKAISSFCYDKMVNLNYIVTYSWCPVVEKIILDAYERGLKFHLCIIDSGTEQRGKQLAKKLSALNIQCTYGVLNALGYVIKQCNMILLGCSAILSNGYVVADRGSSLVALVGSAINVPILVAAQTLKFADTVQLFDRSSSKTNILIEDPKEIVPADLITAVVTELRILHPSSAPAVLKAKQLAVG